MPASGCMCPPMWICMKFHPTLRSLRSGATCTRFYTTKLSLLIQPRKRSSWCLRSRTDVRMSRRRLRLAYPRLSPHRPGQRSARQCLDPGLQRLKAETSIQIGAPALLRFQVNRPTLVVGFVQQTLGKNGADTLSSTEKVAVTVRLNGAEPVERRLGAEKLHEAHGTGRDKARVMRQQTQDSGGGHRIAAGRKPDQQADDPIAERNLHPAEANGVLEDGGE